MLEKALEGLDTYYDPNVLVGFETADDAGVYLLDEGRALVQTVDFFTPVVDDPFVYGQIAAANALSDIYAMGGEPRFALSIVGFPDADLDESVLRETMQGGADKMKEAQVPIIGGHSVRDAEMKFGYVVTGLVDPRKVYRNTGARPGDALVLTKPLGLGVISTAIKFGKCPPDTSAAAVRWMLRLNKTASDALDGLTVHAVTDVTGYGLIGHAYEMALGSGVCLSIWPEKVPVIDGALEAARTGALPGGIESNRRYVGSAASWHGTPLLLQQILLDPQTSGGLLVALPSEEADEFLRALDQRGELGVKIGEARSREDAYISVG